MQEAFKRYQDKLSGRVTTYGHFFGGNVDQKFKFDNILEHKKFTKVILFDFVLFYLIFYLVDCYIIIFLI